MSIGQIDEQDVVITEEGQIEDVVEDGIGIMEGEITKKIGTIGMKSHRLGK